MFVSECCKATIVKGTNRHYPLGGTVWYETLIIDVCECCGNEVDELMKACDECGEVNCIGNCEVE